MAGSMVAPEAEPTATEGQGWVADGRWRARGRTVARPVALFVASRILVLVVAQTVIHLHGQFVSGGYSGPFPAPPAAARPLLKVLGLWDSGWYLNIAGHGYFSGSHAVTATPGVAFFPVWPGLIRGVSAVTGTTLLNAGVGLAFVVGAGAAVALWYLVRELCGPLTADRAVGLWVFFPGAFVLSMVYAEGLTVLCSAVCLLALLRRRWLIAGLAAGVATGVQPDALVLVLCCAFAAGRALWKDRTWRALVALVAPVLSVAGAAGYFAYLTARTGDFLRWYHVEQRDWGSGGGVHQTVVDAVSHALGPAHAPEAVIPALGLVWAAAGLVLLVRWRPPVVIWVFAIGVLVLALASGPVGTRPRLLLVAFPLIVAAARLARGVAFTALVATSAGVLAVVTILSLSGRYLTP